MDRWLSAVSGSMLDEVIVASSFHVCTVCDFTALSRHWIYFRDELITTRNDGAQKVPYLSITFVWCHTRDGDGCRLAGHKDRYISNQRRRQTNPPHNAILFAIHREWCWPNRMLDIVQSICQFVLIDVVVVVIVIGWRLVCVRAKTPMTRLNEPFALFTEPCVSLSAIACPLCNIYSHRLAAAACSLPPVRIINKTFPIRSDIVVSIRLCISSICMQRKQNTSEWIRFDSEKKQIASTSAKVKEKMCWLGSVCNADVVAGQLHQFFSATNCYCLRHIKSIFWMLNGRKVEKKRRHRRPRKEMEKK